MKIKKAEIEFGVQEMLELLKKNFEDKPKLEIKDVNIKTGEIVLFLQLQLPWLGIKNIEAHFSPKPDPKGIKSGISLSGWPAWGDRIIVFLLKLTEDKKIGLEADGRQLIIPAKTLMDSLGLTGDMIIDKLVCTQDKLALSIRGDFKGAWL